LLDMREQRTHKKSTTRPLAGWLVVLFFCLFRVPPVTSATIAVFPLLDLTRGPNGVNYPLSEEVSRVVAERGFEMIYDRDIMDFMVRHRIRNLGRLTSHQMSLLKKELGAEVVMLGTLGKLKESPAPAISISLQLIRTTDAAVLWADTKSLYHTDLASLLGLHDPESLEEMYPLFFRDLFASFPESIAIVEVSENRLDVDTVVLHPSYVQPGDEITCKIKLHTPFAEGEESPEILARVADNEYKLPLDEDGYYFKTTWPAGEKAGEQKVSLWGRWPDGWEKEVDIGSYIVDDQPPEVELFLGAKEQDDELYFNRQLTIIPKLISPEPISRWEITVKDESDAVVVLQSEAQHIPRNLTWRGNTSTGNPAPDGHYRIFLKVWDRAGWFGSGETEIMLRRTSPDITFEVEEKEESVSITVNNLESAPLDFWWLKFFAPDGSLITILEDEALPISLSLDLPASSGAPEERGLECLLVAQDIYGNRVQRKIKDLLRLAVTTEEGDILQETDWVEGF
jgi:hypothetical protein